MDPFLRLTIWMWQLSRRRVSRKEITLFTIVVLVCFSLGLIEWAGYWPENWKVERVGMPKARPL
jgi:hypothetical protein